MCVCVCVGGGGGGGYIVSTETAYYMYIVLLPWLRDKVDRVNTSCWAKLINLGLVAPQIKKHILTTEETNLAQNTGKSELDD